MCCFDGSRKGNYFGEEPLSRAEVGVRMKMLKNCKATGKDRIKGDVRKRNTQFSLHRCVLVCNIGRVVKGLNKSYGENCFLHYL